MTIFKQCANDLDGYIRSLENMTYPQLLTEFYGVLVGKLSHCHHYHVLQMTNRLAIESFLSGCHGMFSEVQGGGDNE